MLLTVTMKSWPSTGTMEQTNRPVEIFWISVALGAMLGFTWCLLLVQRATTHELADSLERDGVPSPFVQHTNDHSRPRDMFPHPFWLLLWQAHTQIPKPSYSAPRSAQ